ncbi:prepilin peptidase [Caldinitratiruptor microaerophilus]|uniref:Prepilin type IV endopeptidase peptidase domain-containing protein n=1 Tax=Caldinitratiruptor microaerophilus TaxID=671077 RepID=A0AA35G7U7_9FIRM|nr:A24 family peptidase [Caldinitratiruptor microaerophilus]BDG60290.1 hypothetical protein caldi_13800 [Caldinitratiruptor microaerophilus]
MGASLAGAAIGGVLAWLGAWVSPRWTTRPRGAWEWALCTVLGAALGYGFGRGPAGLGPEFLRLAVLSAVVITASLVDLHDRIIPNELLLAAAALWLVLQVADPAGWLQALAGGAFGFGVLFLLGMLFRGGMGMGDVKMAGVVGLYLGWPAALAALLAAFVAGGLVSLALLALRRVGRKDQIAFGPFLAAGAIVAALGTPGIAWLSVGVAGP